MHNVINKPEYAETVKELKALYRAILSRLPGTPEGFPGATGNWPSSRSGTAPLQRLTPPFTVPPRNRVVRNTPLTTEGQGLNPHTKTRGENGARLCHGTGYAKSLKWLDQRDKNKPFMLVVGHKAPHRCWCPSIQNLGRAKQYADAIDPPANLEDDFADRPEFLKMTEQTLLNHFNVWSGRTPDQGGGPRRHPENAFLPGIQDPAYSV